MRKIILLTLLIFTVFLGLILGPIMVDYDGYVLVVMENGTLQLRIFGVLLLMFGLVIFTWLAFWLLRNLLRLFSGSRNWLWGWSSRKRQNAFTGGLLSLAAGDYQEAQKHLAKIEYEDFDGVNLLAAAEVEIQLQNPEKARQLWEHATEYPKAVVAAKLNLIRHYLSLGDTQQAQTLVNSFDEKQAKLKSVVVVSAQTLAQSGKWQELDNKPSLTR